MAVTLSVHIFGLCLLQVIGHSVVGESCAALNDEASFLATDTRFIEHPKAEQQESGAILSQEAQAESSQPTPATVAKYLKKAKVALKAATKARKRLHAMKRKTLAGDINRVRGLARTRRQLRTKLSILKAKIKSLTSQANLLKKTQKQTTIKSETKIAATNKQRKRVEASIKKEQRHLASKVSIQDQAALRAFVKARKNQATTSNNSMQLRTILKKDRATYQAEIVNQTKRAKAILKKEQAVIDAYKKNQTIVKKQFAEVKESLKKTLKAEAGIIKRIHRIAAGLKKR